MNDKEAVEKSPSKSALIVEHLDRLDSAVVKLETLAERITGQQENETTKADKDLNGLSVSSLLDTIPGLLDGFTSDIHKAVDKITEALY